MSAVSLVLEKLRVWFVATTARAHTFSISLRFAVTIFKSCFDWFPDVSWRMVITIYQHEVGYNTDLSSYLYL